MLSNNIYAQELGLLCFSECFFKKLVFFRQLRAKELKPLKFNTSNVVCQTIYSGLVYVYSVHRLIPFKSAVVRRIRYDQHGLVSRTLALGGVRTPNDCCHLESRGSYHNYSIIEIDARYDMV